MNQAQIIIADLLAPGIRTAGNNLHRISPITHISRNLEQPVFQKQILPCSIIPVQHETHGERSHRRAFDTDMGIPPVPELLIFSDIFPPHIKSADESNPSVYDHNLPVVAVIHTELQLPKQSRKEFCHLDSRLLKARPVGMVHSPAPHTVEQDADFHALPRLAYQNLLNLLPEFVVLNNIILHMDIVPCVIHLRKQRLELLPSICKYTDIVVIRQHSLRFVQIIENQPLETVKLRISQP